MLDAFSSDAIPAHLLTREAMRLYRERLSDRGVLAVQRRAFDEAREQLELAGSDDRALLLLGQLASNGQGEPTDPVKAGQLYERAAEYGWPIMFRTGTYVFADVLAVVEVARKFPRASGSVKQGVDREQKRARC